MGIGDLGCEYHQQCMSFFYGEGLKKKQDFWIRKAWEDVCLIAGLRRERERSWVGWVLAERGREGGREREGERDGEKSKKSNALMISLGCKKTRRIKV